MAFKKYLFSFLTLFGISLVLSAYAFAACSPVNECGGSGGSDCPTGQMCTSVMRGTECRVSEACGGTPACEGSGCGPGNGCNGGQTCSFGSCVDAPETCPLTPPGDECSDANGTCGALPGQSGGSCPAGQSCSQTVPFGPKLCRIDSNCPEVGEEGSECSAQGCGNGCAEGFICKIDTSNPGSFVCAEDLAGNCDGGQSCSPLGCGGSNGCSPGQKCVPGSRSCAPGQHCPATNVCVTDNTGECDAHACTGNGGCDPDGICGPGYRCQDYHCVIDTTCLMDTIQVPYTGPKIRNFSTVMAALYNLLFPASILFGAIMVIVAGYKLMTSEGDPRKTKEGQEDLSSALMGTAFVVLSATILRIIIRQILGGSVNL